MKTNNKRFLLYLFTPFLLVVIILTFYINLNDNQPTKQLDVSLVNINSCLQDETSAFSFKEKGDDPSYLSTTLILTCSNKNLEGYMFGPYPAQEHGLFYFSERLSNLNVLENSISFEIESRDLFNKPFNFATFKQGTSMVGESFSRMPVSFRGIIKTNVIELDCLSGPLECYSDKMIFNLLE